MKKKESLKNLLNRFNLNNIKLKSCFAEADISFTKADQSAAWDMYVELITRTATQPLADNSGDEETALQSVYGLFAITRSILKEKGRTAKNFTKIAIIVLNQIIRPFTSKWHQKLVNHSFDNSVQREQFRRELNELQESLKCYTKLLADLAEVEDLTDTFYSENTSDIISEA